MNEDARYGRAMMKWLRKVVPDLFLAAVVALLVTVAMQRLNDVETARIEAEGRAAARDGLTLDERIDVVDGSIRRSTLVHLPALIALSGAIVGLAARHRRWAWLTAVGSVLPALIMGVAFFVDRPLPASVLVGAYLLLAISTAMAGTALRRRLEPVSVHNV
jgi:hypothetical protein